MFRVRICFTLFMIVLFGYAAFASATSFAKGAGIFPLVLAIPGFILCLIQLLRETITSSKSAGDQAGDYVDVLPDSSIPHNVAFRKALRMLIWILCLYLTIWILGFKIAFIAFFILYLRLEGHTRWTTTLTLTAIAAYAIFFHFEKVMGIHWPESLLSKWIGVSWLY